MNARRHFIIKSGALGVSFSLIPALLEAQGLEVRQAFLFDRPTKLEGEDGMRNWLAMFAESMFVDLPVEAKEAALDEVEARLRATNFKDGVWYADYRRLRVVAVRSTIGRTVAVRVGAGAGE